MQPSKCPGCRKEFEDPRGFSNHKRRCKLVKITTAQRYNQLKAKKNQAKRNQMRNLQVGVGSMHIEEGQGGPTIIDGDNATSMALVRLHLLRC